jgi:hypothetical protein
MAHLGKLPQASPQCYPAGVTDQQGREAFEVRFGTATAEAIPTAKLPPHPTNGDEQRYPDRSATYTKCLKQNSPGIVNPQSFNAFRKALGTPGHMGDADFEVKGLLGLGRPLNGPQGAFANTLVGADSQNYGAPLVPAAPALASPEYATELVELYWASLLRDVAFADYPTNATAIAAAKELSGLASYAGPRDASGKVTPELLFRGGSSKAFPGFFEGETIGPYVSQFAILATALGVQPIDQKLDILAPGVDYLTDLKTWADVQNGSSPPMVNPVGQAYLYNGRGLASYTHVDELYQAYFIAYLVLKTLKIEPNPGSPYNPKTGYKQQAAFGTFGGPDIASTLAAVARTAINSVWWQKWIVHLRHRPESGGGLVDLLKTKQPNLPAAAKDLSKIILDSQALQESQKKYGSYLLAQAFPEGSPAHPAYPTGHGTVGGACITVLKFFYNGGVTIPAKPGPMVSTDGRNRVNYTGPDAGKLTVNGELHKLAHNISFGHGIHAGIHWRSDTDISLLQGEEIALRYLQDQAWTYKEDFLIKITKMDGSTATISN